MVLGGPVHRFWESEVTLPFGDNMSTYQNLKSVILT